MDWTTTTSVLLEALYDPANQSVWQVIDARYRPIISGFARRLGLDPEDAAEVAQQTLTEFVRDYRAGKYDRGKGRLSAWIIGIARHRAIDLQRARAKRREWRGTSAVVDLADEQQLAETWEAEQQRAIFNQAWAALRQNTKTDENTLRAFELFAVEGVAAESVSEQCGLTVAEVYRVKNRITRRLREIVAQLTDAYAEDD